MKNIVFLVGNSYALCESLRNYAIRIAKTRLSGVDKVLIYEEIEEDFYLDLEFFSQKSNEILIFYKDYEAITKEIQERITDLTCEDHDRGKVFYKDYCKITIFRDLEPSSEAEKNTMKIYLLGIDGESALTLLTSLAKEHHVELSMAKSYGVEILIAKEGALEFFCKDAKLILGDKIVFSENLAQSVIKILKENDKKITTAESCTGGLMAYFLTKESGASEVFDGGMISYANAIKEAWLKVEGSLLDTYGAVSEGVVGQMLSGALELSGADFSIATSGIAGPNGGSKDKPVGLVYIGVKSKSGDLVVERVIFKGDRKYIQEQAVSYAFLLFLKVFYKIY